MCRLKQKLLAKHKANYLEEKESCVGNKVGLGRVWALTPTQPGTVPPTQMQLSNTSIPNKNQNKDPSAKPDSLQGDTRVPQARDPWDDPSSRQDFTAWIFAWKGNLSHIDPGPQRRVHKFIHIHTAHQSDTQHSKFSDRRIRREGCRLAHRGMLLL